MIDLRKEDSRMTREYRRRLGRCEGIGEGICGVVGTVAAVGLCILLGKGCDYYENWQENRITRSTSEPYMATIHERSPRDSLTLALGHSIELHLKREHGVNGAYEVESPDKRIAGKAFQPVGAITHDGAYRDSLEILLADETKVFLVKDPADSGYVCVDWYLERQQWRTSNF